MALKTRQFDSQDEYFVASWVEKKRARRNAFIGKAVITLAVAAATFGAIQGFKKREEIKVDGSRILHVLGSSDQERDTLFWNPAIRTDSPDEIRESVLTAYTTQKFFEHSPPPISLEDLQEQIDDVGENIIVFGVKELPQEFWKNFTSEEVKFIKEHVKCLAFGENLTGVNSLADRGRIASYLGEGAVAFDSRVTEVSGENADVFRSIVAHEAQHGFNQDLDLPLLIDEKTAYETALTFLERQPQTEEIKTEIGKILNTLNVADFLIKNYGHVPEIGNMHPGSGLRAIQLQKAGVNPGIPPIDDPDEPGLSSEMQAALFAAHVADHEFSALKKLIEDYMYEFVQNGDTFNLLVADNLAELIMENYPDQFPDELKFLLENIGNKQSSSDYSFLLLVMNINSSVLSIMESMATPISESPDLDEVLGKLTPQDVELLGKFIDGSMRKKILTGAEINRLLSRLYISAFYYLNKGDFVSAYRYLHNYVDPQYEYLDSDGEVNAVFGRLILYLGSHQLFDGLDYSDQKAYDDVYKTSVTYFQRGLQLLGPEIYEEIFGELYPDENKANNLDFSYIPKHTPSTLNFSRRNLFEE